MKLSLLTMDHSPIPPDNWLQFDVRNQEFYGVPMSSDEGSKEYQLVSSHKFLYFTVQFLSVFEMKGSTIICTYVFL